MLVPFALWVTLFLGLVISGMEMGTVTLRATVLERALDQTVREIRLGTGTIYDHGSIKTKICDNAGILPNCSENLRLEMVKLDLRNWQEPPDAVDCVDHSEPVAPVVTFEYGRDNELMFLRACFKFKPFSPTTGLGQALTTDSEGYTAITSTSAFVQEPS
ncbi:TadE/TadG family type IV pilus assembly protein [Thalassococcus sp. BH17M4-6]|uniref:TadE/TadG family type IV pilus assembly protein n=1 Tax=Thalassococcus sp. BH17M4-6 TaxID=3413148 RepID=UPI003BDB7F0B